jgi:hypothetical protein
MNNFTFGNARYQYYETISGGSGAGRGFAGTSVVQTHMTNSRLTDPRCSSSASRCASTATRCAPARAAGALERRRRRRAPGPLPRADDRVDPVQQPAQGAFGAQGGGAGLPGINRVERADGSVVRSTTSARSRWRRRRLRDRVARRRQLRRAVGPASTSPIGPALRRRPVCVARSRSSRSARASPASRLTVTSSFVRTMVPLRWLAVLQQTSASHLRRS